MTAAAGESAREQSALVRVREALARPVDSASVSFFRAAFGLLLLVAIVRFVAGGLLAEYYLAPKFFFPFYGLSWLRPLPGKGMYIAFGFMALSAAGITLGVFARVSAVVFGVLFTYAHLLDKTHYLNHYHLVSLLVFLCAWLPLDRAWSVRVLLDPTARRDHVPVWVLWVLRFQIGCVYFFGGIAKLSGDWILRAQPLRIWLAGNGDLPVFGPLLVKPVTAHLMSIGGLVFDLTVPFFLLHRKTRPYAYAAVLFFHVATGRLFQLGMFPWFMCLGALLFFPPDFPRRLLLGSGRKTPPEPARGELLGLTPLALLFAYVALQLLLPLRQLAYPGNACWTEQGYYFAWKVMLMEKNGDAELWVTDTVTGKRYLAEPREVLTPYQKKVMSTQPTMLLAFARFLGKEWGQRLGHPVEVHADVFVSLNGGPRQRLIDPAVDLSRQEDGLWPARWILPLDESLQSRRR